MSTAVAVSEHSTSPYAELLAIQAAVTRLLEAHAKSPSALHTPIRKPLPNKYHPSTRPASKKWKSKHPSLVQSFMEALLEDREPFVVRCPPASTETGVTAKLMVGLVTARFAPKDAIRGDRTHYSLAITDVLARMVEFAASVRSEDPKFAGALFEVQKTYESPGFRSRETRGAGLVMNEAGETLLLPLAIEHVFDAHCGVES
jgi:hypothetical protein